MLPYRRMRKAAWADGSHLQGVGAGPQRRLQTVCCRFASCRCAVLLAPLSVLVLLFLFFCCWAAVVLLIRCSSWLSCFFSISSVLSPANNQLQSLLSTPEKLFSVLTSFVVFLLTSIRSLLAHSSPAHSFLKNNSIKANNSTKNLVPSATYYNVISKCRQHHRPSLYGKLSCRLASRPLAPHAQERRRRRPDHRCRPRRR